MTLILLKYYALLLTSGAAIVGLGLLLLRWLGQRQAGNPEFTLLLAFLAGTTAVVTVYSLAMTRGSTINLLFLPLLALYLGPKLLVRGQRAPAPDAQLASWWWAEALVVLTLGFAWQAVSMYDPAYGYFITPNADLVFAARNIHLLNELGIERTIYTDGPVAAVAGNTPYHYFEYWLIAALAKVSGDLPIFNLKLNQVPLFLLGTYWGLGGLVRHYLPMSWLAKVVCFFLLFAHFPFYSTDWLNNLNTFQIFVTTNVAMQEPMLFKTLPIYVFALAALIFGLRGQWNGAFMMLLGLPIACTTTAPVIFPGLGLALLTVFGWQLGQGQTFWRVLRTSVFAKNLYWSVALAAGIGAFYVFTSSASNTNLAQSDYSLANIQTNLFSLDYLLTKSGLLAKELVWLLLLACPWPILVVVQRRSGAVGQRLAGWLAWFRQWQAAPIMLTLGLILLTGLAASAYLSFNRYSFVFYRIMGIPVLYLLVVWAGLLAIVHCRFYWLRILTIAFVLVHGAWSAISVVNFDLVRRRYVTEQYSDGYLQAVAQAVVQLPTRRGAYLKSGQIEDYPVAYTHTDYNQALNPVFYFLGRYLTFVDAGATVSLIGNLYDLTNDDGQTIGTSKEALPFLHFYKYIGQQPKGPVNVDTQLKFIRDEKIGFLLVSKYALVDEKIKQLVQREEIDPVSGERFLLLKHSHEEEKE
jgi:hypothetical protein